MQIKKILQNFRPKEKALLGVDLGAHFVRIVVLSYFDSYYTVEACISMQSDDAMSDNEIIAALKKISIQTQFTTKDAAIALPDSMIIVKSIKVESGLTAKEVKGFLQFNLAGHVGESTSQASFDYQIIARTIDKDKQQKLQLVAARQAHVDKYLAILRTANLRPKIVDIKSHALARAVRWQYRNIAGLIAVVNIDCDDVLIMMINQERISHHHESMISTARMQSLSQVLEYLKGKLQPLLTTSQQPIEKLILAGERATLSGLVEAINKHFNVSAIVFNPFMGMKFAPTISQEYVQKYAPAMLVSCGLALRATDATKY